MHEDRLSLLSGTDVRGDAVPREGHPAALTEDVARALGAAFARFLRAQGHERPLVAVGRDSRVTGEALLRAAVEGLCREGARVRVCGLCTTPAMFMTTVTDGFMADGSVMITASHHPWYRNGLKFFTAQGGLSAQEVGGLLQDAQDAPAGMPDGADVSEVDFLSVYARQLEEKVRAALGGGQRPLTGLHVAVDAGNGVGGFYARVLQALGAATSGSQFLEPDGMFPNHMPNPEDEEAMRAISRAVCDSGADLGVIFDTDCDRAAIVDATGREINRNRLIALISAILLAQTPGATIVTDSVTSSGLADFIRAHGGVHHRFKRGYHNVIEEARRLCAAGVDCPLAIETSGHAALRENYFLDDGMYLVTRLIVAAMRKKAAGGGIGDWIKGLREPVEAREVRIGITAADFRAAGAAALAAFEAYAPAHGGQLAQDSREGVRASFDVGGRAGAGWLLIRMSVHDPVMPVNCESDVAGGVHAMLTVLSDALAGCEGLDLSPLRQALEA